ncbi:spore germination protein [Kyrpidia tusciae]|uniref:GerA spore germination protein n=1 Tax=Kyrpidia tusciae (strain DSM 2912 / NBRC 15312 / T2) TaxID=562970 RepID=D5WWG0_KYRT2|nr:spore germination protein [Kyrpidia tusciae]ADG07725.1 GerA spore germination protein [Kyrpidia tusciae DSM 2912]
MVRRDGEGRGKNRKNKQISWSDPQGRGEGAAGLSPEIDRLYQQIQEMWTKCDDVQFRWIETAGRRGFIIWIYTLIGKELAQESILEPLTTLEKAETVTDVQRALRSPSLRLVNSVEEINIAVGEGAAVLCLDGFNQAIVLDVMQFQGRPVERSTLEAVVRGPQEAFTESLEMNLGLIRRRLKSPRVKVEYMALGRVSKTMVALVYIQGIVKPGYVKECQERLNRIDADSILDSGYIEELIDDAPLSPFPTIEYTERPDRLAAEALQGRVGIVVDGSPNALLIPALFVNFLQSPEDYFERYSMALAVRLLRHMYFWIALLLPATYVALLSYHQEMIPTTLLMTLTASHEGVPFPAVVEALIMEVTFEALREAGIRLPKAVGQSVSIVGALVIGEAAVNAGIVSPAMVIIVALTGIASFTIPSYNIAITFRLLRFPMMIMAGLFGLYGIIISLLVLWIHLVSLRSFGVPYMAPIAPLVWEDLKDTFSRPPWWYMKKRPKMYETVDPTRSADIPRPLPGKAEEDPL